MDVRRFALKEQPIHGRLSSLGWQRHSKGQPNGRRERAAFAVGIRLLSRQMVREQQAAGCKLVFFER